MTEQPTVTPSPAVDLVERLGKWEAEMVSRQLAYQKACGISEPAALLPPDDPRAKAYHQAVMAMHNMLPSLWSLLDSIRAALTTPAPAIGEEEAREVYARELDRGMPLGSEMARLVRSGKLLKENGIHAAALRAMLAFASLRSLGDEGADLLTEAKHRLALTEGSLDCNADDERFWRNVIAFLERKEPWFTTRDTIATTAGAVFVANAQPEKRSSDT